MIEAVDRIPSTMIMPTIINKMRIRVKRKILRMAKLLILKPRSKIIKMIRLKMVRKRPQSNKRPPNSNLKNKSIFWTNEWN